VIWLIVITLFLVLELMAYLMVFRLLGRLYLRPDASTRSGVDIRDFSKGVLERIVLSYALAHSTPQILIFFGAMKLGTRLKDKTEGDHYNDFFLIGNLVSVMLALLYSKYLVSDSELISFVAGLLNTYVIPIFN
jgi:hypothetical protein